MLPSPTLCVVKFKDHPMYLLLKPVCLYEKTPYFKLVPKKSHLILANDLKNNAT